MATLNITVLRHNGTPLDPPIRAEFGAAGGTIGRGHDSTLLLPDPDRIISRVHALVIAHDGGFVVRDQGTTVPVIINGRRLGRGRESALASGDELQIGGYTMGVEQSGVVSSETTIIDQTLNPDLQAGTLLSWTKDGAPAAPDRIATVVVPSPEGAQEHAGPASAAPAAPIRSASGTGDTAEPSPGAIAARSRVAAAPSASPDELAQALLRGAGARDLAIPGGLTPEFMEDLGGVMREMLRGMLDLLLARAMAKREVRAEATIIVAHDNNPLKFSPSLEAAITHLLVPRGQGFMPPLRAIGDACDSLRSHQLGFVAGMQAALAAVLGRFDPAKLESRFPPDSMADSLLPLNRKARLWKQYEDLHEQVSREAEKDFRLLFGEEFLRAYQARVGASQQARDANRAP